LVRLRRESASRTIYVIAHSHGGSVFAYALKHEPSLADQIDGFIALATPWIDVMLCGYATQLRAFLWRTVLYLSAASTLIALGYLMEYVVAWQVRMFGASRDGFEVLADYIVDYYFAGALVGALFYLLGRRLDSWLVRTRTAFHVRTEEVARRFSTLHERFPASVFLKPVGDEAALALGFTSAMATLAHAASQLLFVILQSLHDCWFRIPRPARIVGGVIVALLAAAGTTSFAMDGAFAETPLRVELSRVMDKVIHDTFQRLLVSRFDPFAVLSGLSQGLALTIWVAGPVLAGVLASITAVALIAAAGAGLPTLTAGLYFQVSVEAIPEGSYRLVLVEPQTAATQPDRISSSRLSHTGVYDSPGAIAAVLTAFDAFERGQATSSA
jgi:hypothetical protein